MIIDTPINTDMLTKVHPNQKEFELNQTFDENNTDEIDAKKELNKLLLYIPFLSPNTWEEIMEKLNEGILGSPVAAKDCYRIGCIDKLKQYAIEKQTLFAKDGTKLYVYNNRYWIQVSEDLIKFFLHKAMRNMGIPNAYNACVKFTKSVHEQLIESGFYEKAVKPEDTHLNLKNGTLKINQDGVELINHNPKHFLTHQLDFRYEPDIVNEEWLDFLNMVLPDKDTQKTLQQAIGYLFIKDLKLEKAIFLYGIGSNGKSVIFEVLKGILDSDMMTNYSLSHLTNHLGYQVAALNNKLINYGTDISMKNVDIAIFKQLVSGEPIGTRQIREKAFTMTNYAKLIFNVNKLDDADTENTHGFFRRMIFIPFDITITIEQQDKKLHKKLLQNKTGILNWIVAGIKEVLKNEEIFLSEKSAHFLDNFRREASPIQIFLDDSGLTPTQDSNEFIAFQRVYEMYREFCKKQGERPIPQRSFNADLKKLGFERKRTKNGNVWFAILDEEA